ncbi:MAG: hypothetical protein BGO77_07330 [Caedibacter sp. 37-49]|nr:MAG: hypothetical protein BGO77_07330 [Caedibacter sp. 37-49]
MLSKTIKIAASIVLACSISYLGKASDSIIEQDVSPSPSSSTTQPSITDESLVQKASEGISSSSVSTDASDSPKSPSTRKKVLRRKSTGSKSSKVEKTEAASEAPKKTPLSQGMQIDLLDGKSILISRLTMPELETAPLSQNFLAPQQIHPAHLVLALVVSKIDPFKEASTLSNTPHPVVYIPELKMFLGFKSMQSGTLAELATILNYNEFKDAPNIKNAETLLCISTTEDLEKTSTPVDMETAKDLITETQYKLWLDTGVTIKLEDSEKRPEKSTIATQCNVRTDSNLATYVLYHKRKLFDANQEDFQAKVLQTKTGKLEQKDKKKTTSKSSKSKAASSESEPKLLKVLLSVTKIKEQPRSLKREKSTTSRKRSVSKGTSSTSSSAVESPTSPRAQKEKAPETSPSLPEVSTQPSLTPPSSGV